ncbi:peptidylprolyl isomerase, partial [Acidobacteriota bacterium]
EEEFRTDIESSIRIQKLMEQAIPKTLPVSDDEIAVYYRGNVDKFQIKERVKAGHILIKISPADTAEAKAAAQDKLKKIKSELKKGADFSKLASQYSDCPSAAQGGDLGYFGKGKMVKPFEDAAFSLKVGEVSDIVETQFGYHLIMKTDSQEARTLTLEEAKEQIVQSLQNDKRGKAVNDYIAKLRSSAKIVYAEGFKP